MKFYHVGVQYPQGTGLFDIPYTAWIITTQSRIIAFYHEQRLGMRELWRFFCGKKYGTVVTLIVKVG